MKKNNKTLVALYVRYGTENVENSQDQETQLKKYCRKKGYRVINIYRDIENLQLYYSESILGIIADSMYIQYDKLLMVDIYQISEKDAQIAAFWELIDNQGISLETLQDGIIGKDLLFGTIIHKNVMNNSKLKNVNNDF